LTVLFRIVLEVPGKVIRHEKGKKNDIYIGMEEVTLSLVHK
jgi:hypothetical protein